MQKKKYAAALIVTSLLLTACGTKEQETETASLAEMATVAVTEKVEVDKATTEEKGLEDQIKEIDKEKVVEATNAYLKAQHIERVCRTVEIRGKGYKNEFMFVANCDKGLRLLLQFRVVGDEYIVGEREPIDSTENEVIFTDEDGNVKSWE